MLIPQAPSLPPMVSSDHRTLRLCCFPGHTALAAALLLLLSLPGLARAAMETACAETSRSHPDATATDPLNAGESQEHGAIRTIPAGADASGPAATRTDIAETDDPDSANSEAGASESGESEAGEPATGNPESDESDDNQYGLFGRTPGLLGKTIDLLHTGISAGVEHSARKVDSFFADDRFYADTNESYARVSGETTWEAGDGTSSQARVRARIDLPGTRERLRLFMEGGDPEDDSSTESSSIPKALDDNDYNIGLEAQLENTGQWDIRPGAGVKARMPPDPFLRIRAIRYERLDGWLMRFAAGAAEYLDDGTELQTRLDFDRTISPDWLFRSGSRVRYRDSKDRIEALQQFSVFQKLSDRKALAYEIGLLAHDDPNWGVDHYYAQFRARFRVYKKWLFVELKPQLVFREEDDYDPSFLFALRVDTVFGARYR